MRRFLPLVLLVSCRSAPVPPPVEDPPVTPVRVAPPDTVVSCAEWVRRAVASPDLEVEKVPTPVAYVPAPIPRRLPSTVYDKSGKAEIRVKVLVDTVGKAVMSTFQVVTSTSPRLTASVKDAVAKWTFTPAEIGGCKVPRHFNWGATAQRPRPRR